MYLFKKIIYLNSFIHIYLIAPGYQEAKQTLVEATSKSDPNEISKAIQNYRTLMASEKIPARDQQLLDAAETQKDYLRIKASII